ncbi:unnamed protein product [Ascophyllum nodosum]
MMMKERCAGRAVGLLLVLVMNIGTGEAFFGRRGGGDSGGSVAAVPNTSGVKLSPAMMEETARKAANAIVMWGTTTVFQLKQASQLRVQAERLRRERSKRRGGGMSEEDTVKMDPNLYKQVVQGAVGGVFLAMNSPAMGKVSEFTAALMKDGKRQARVIDLDRKVREAMSNRNNPGKSGASQDPEGFLEGALLNKDVSAAHDKFIADVEALANSGLAKKVASSAEAYHDVMLQYATADPRNKPAEAR